MAINPNVDVTLSLSVDRLTRLGHDTFKCILDTGGSNAQAICLKLEDDNDAGRAWNTFSMTRNHRNLLYAHGRYKVPKLENRIYMVTEVFSYTLDEWKGKLLDRGLLHPDFVTILSDVMEAILFIFDHDYSHGNISLNSVYIVHESSGVRAKLGNMRGQKGKNLAGDVKAFAEMIENIFQSKGLTMTIDVTIFLRNLRTVLTREKFMDCQNHIVLAPPDGRRAFRIHAFREGEERDVNDQIATGITNYLTNHGLLNAGWRNLTPCTEIKNLTAYQKPISNESSHDFMNVSRAFAVHSNDASVNTGSMALKANYIDHELNTMYNGFAAAWYEVSIKHGIKFTPFRRMLT